MSKKKRFINLISLCALSSILLAPAASAMNDQKWLMESNIQQATGQTAQTTQTKEDCHKLAQEACAKQEGSNQVSCEAQTSQACAKVEVKQAKAHKAHKPVSMPAQKASTKGKQADRCEAQATSHGHAQAQSSHAQSRKPFAPKRVHHDSDSDGSSSSSSSDDEVSNLALENVSFAGQTLGEQQTKKYKGKTVSNFNYGQSTFVASRLRNMTFIKSNFQRTFIHYSQWQGTTFEACDFTGAQIVNKLHGKHRKPHMQRTTWTNCSKLDLAKLDGGRWDGASFNNMSFKNSYVNGANMRATTWGPKVDLTGTQFIGVDFTDAKVYENGQYLPLDEHRLKNMGASVVSKCKGLAPDNLVRTAGVLF